MYYAYILASRRHGTLYIGVTCRSGWRSIETARLLVR
jgi:predicted GIY-YIG superfamily endonuclease